jgi:hypothetical protein
MDRVIALLLRWERLERRCLPAATPRRVRLALAVALIIATGAVLHHDIAYLLAIPTRPIPIDDIFAYECYSQAFWHGSHAVSVSPHTIFCSDHRWRFWVAPPHTFHTLPREYPVPALAVFSLPLLAPFAPYNVVYMWMLAALVLGVVAWLAPRRFLSAVALALYVLVAGWATAVARFDLVPGVLVLIAVACAERKQYTTAYLALAAATLLKVFPVVLAPALLIHEWRATRALPRRNLALFALAVIAGFLPGALLDPSAFISPLTYNTVRPLHIESVAGSLLWLLGRVTGGVRVILSYHSLNVVGPLGAPLAWLATALLAGGLLLVYWRALKGCDDLGRSFVLALLVTLCGGKLLSPQYLLWLLPLAAYVEGLRVRWLTLSLLTLAIYPNAYTLDLSLVHLPNHAPFMLAILGRNGILLGLTALYLWPSATGRLGVMLTLLRAQPDAPPAPALPDPAHPVPRGGSVAAPADRESAGLCP